jgi:Tfp pilus assembly protein PilO
MSRGVPDEAVRRLDAWLHAVGAICALAIFFLAWLCFFAPIDASARASREETTQLREVIANSRQIRNDHAYVSEQLAANRREASQLAANIPDEPREAEFLAQLTQLADDVGIEIQDYRPGQTRRYESHCVLTVDLVCVGRYPGICRFLEELPDLARRCAVEDLEISAAPVAEQYETRITLRLYYGVGVNPGALSKQK